MRKWPRFALAAFGLAAACVGDVETADLPAADLERFVEIVQPVLSERCANPSCHGNVRRPLEIFAPSLHREDGAGTHAPDDLSEFELRANFDRARGFLVDLDRARDSLLLTKPLAMRAGGSAHVDVDVFETTDDPEYIDILDWVFDSFERAEGDAE